MLSNDEYLDDRRSIKGCDNLMGNEIIYKDDQYQVTNMLFISHNITYSLQQLTSYKLEKGEKKFPLTFLVLSLLLIVTGLLLNFQYSSFIEIIGVLGVIITFIAYFVVKPIHKLTVVFSSGEREMIEDNNLDNLVVISNAISLAITKE